MNTHPDRPLPTASRPGGDDNLIDLLRQLTQQGAHLAEQQLALVKAEVREAAGDMKAAIGSMAGAAVVGIAGLGTLLIGLGHVLGQALGNLGLGIVIVGTAALLIAAVLYGAGRKKLDASSLTPDRSLRTLERTPDAVRGTLNPEHR